MNNLRVAATMVLAVGVFATLAACSGSSSSYSGTLTYLAPTDAHDVTVTVSVKNTGSQAGKPQCDVIVISADGSVWGSTTVQDKASLAPGETTDFNTVVNVGSGDASKVTFKDSSGSGNIDCH